jgi:hypothetical protein
MPAPSGRKGKQTWLTIRRSVLETQPAIVAFKWRKKSAYRRAARAWTIF